MRWFKVRFVCMKLFDYLHTIGWIDQDTVGGGPQAAVHQLAQLLDLDLSIELADMVENRRSVRTIEEEDVHALRAPSSQLELVCRDTHQKFTLALANWDRGRYRVIHGQRVGDLLTQAGFGTVEKSDERWQRTGRLMWSSIQEFIETHFKRARMKVRMANQGFRANAEQWSQPVQHLVALDEVLLKAKLRQTEALSTWVIRVAHGQFLKQWQAHRPALETKEALSVLVENTSSAGWTGSFIKELGQAFTCLLIMESEACTVFSRALDVYPPTD